MQSAIAPFALLMLVLPLVVACNSPAPAAPPTAAPAAANSPAPSQVAALAKPSVVASVAVPSSSPAAAVPAPSPGAAVRSQYALAVGLQCQWNAQSQRSYYSPRQLSG